VLVDCAWNGPGLTSSQNHSLRWRRIFVNEPLLLADDRSHASEQLTPYRFDNEVYEASGSKKTATACGTDLVGVARAAGIKNSDWANNLSDFRQAISAGITRKELSFIGAKVTTERTDVAPYPLDEVENKYRFIRYVEKTEQLEILKTNLPASYV
jgi:hypothetical protein